MVDYDARASATTRSASTSATPRTRSIQQFTADDRGGLRGGSRRHQRVDRRAGDAGGPTELTAAATASTGDRRRSRLCYFYYETDVLVGESGTELKRHNNIDAVHAAPERGDARSWSSSASPRAASRRSSRSRARSSSVSGQGTCYPGPESCQLLGPAGRERGPGLRRRRKTYRVEVARSSSSRAPSRRELGEPASQSKAMGAILRRVFDQRMPCLPDG